MTQANHVAGVVRAGAGGNTVANRVEVEVVVDSRLVGQLGVASVDAGALGQLVGVQGGPDVRLGVSQRAGFILDLARTAVFQTNGVLAEGLSSTDRPGVTLVVGTVGTFNLGVIEQGSQLGIGRQGVKDSLNNRPFTGRSS